MMGKSLLEHLAARDTTVCRAWKVERRDGNIIGFTDHDLDLVFDGVTYSARTGLTARALQQTTGLSVDNSEAMGALSDAAVKEEDIVAGRYDDAEVTAYLVNWQDTELREVLFQGNFGEITRENGAFRVELRGLAERLNIPSGRAYVAHCAASLGDARCKADLTSAGLTVEAEILEVAEDGLSLTFSAAETATDGWYAGGRVTMLDGTAYGLVREIRMDRTSAGRRTVVLWQGLVPAPKVGDRLRLVVGCDRRASTCRARFDNILNFRGFPHIPGEDWLRRPPEAEPRRTPFGTGVIPGFSP